MKYRQWNPTHPFAAKVAQELHKRAWTARKLAAAMGVAPCSVGRVLNGWRKPSLSWRVRACRALGWPVPDHCTPPPAEPRPLPYVVTRIKEAATNQGRSTAWLARAAGMPAWQLEAVLAGHRRLGPVPRKGLYQALGLR